MSRESVYSKIKSVKTLLLCAAVVLLALLARPGGLLRQAQTKTELDKFEPALRSAALNDEVREKLKNPLTKAGQVVFLSVCDGKQRARVYSGTGPDLDSAWSAAKNKLEDGLIEQPLQIRWLKADIVCRVQPVSAKQLAIGLKKARHNYYRFGLSFDSTFSKALIEQEMDGARGYNYEKGGLHLSNINSYLKKAHRPTISKLPKKYWRFQCLGYLYGEDGQIYALTPQGREYGRRLIGLIDKAYAAQIISNASAYLRNQIKPDGTFCYAIQPRINKESKSYNTIRHAGAIWSLCQSYRVNGEASDLKEVQKAIGYLQKQTIYSAPDACYLYSPESNDCHLGGNALAILALTEYMDAAKTDEYKELCRAYGNGILTMMDQKTGEFVHILKKDFSLKQKFSVIYYDGEAAFALARLYKLTGDKKYLEAAQRAADHFIAADYTKHCDHWVAYAFNEITKYTDSRPDYYQFALKNITVNMNKLEQIRTPAPTKLEMLMAAFETYDRMLNKGLDPGKFDSKRFLRLIYSRADVQLNGYFFPEFAMYMAEPERILYAFTERAADYRTRIDDVQHNLGGYCAYWNNYDSLIGRGLLDSLQKPENSPSASSPKEFANSGAKPANSKAKPAGRSVKPKDKNKG
ncbi:MAG: hypothetical protein Q4F00_13830 [bacterium]|nr:hypothetical protein [bacterium]